MGRQGEGPDLPKVRAISRGLRDCPALGDPIADGARLRGT